MMKWVVVLCALLQACVLCGASNTLWPLPSTVSTGSTVLYVDPTQFKITSSVSSSVLDQAIARYFNNSSPSAACVFFPFTGTSPPPTSATLVTSLTLNVASANETLQLGVDEWYSVYVDQSGGGATSSSNTIYGAMRALETFSQLIEFDDNTMTYQITSAPVTVSDTPRFAWRGLLIDSARHYLSLSTIKRTIDALSYSKFNTLHWHVVDAESFPVEIDALPELSAKGAYAPSAIYDVDDIKEVQSYALSHGIRLVMEFDMPGHAYSWGLGYPNLTVTCPSYQSNINNIPLDPTQTFTYDAIETVLQTVSSLMQDDYWHIGGDEVVTGCWLDNANVTSWMSDHGISSSTQLLQYFEDNLAKIMSSIGKKAVVWEDLFDNGISLAPGTIVEIWNGADTLTKVVKAGIPAINSYGWYLNNQEPVPGVTVAQWVDTWKSMYAYDPVAGLGLSPSEQALVYGGEAAMWAEQVNSVNFDSRVWPRACAVAERLWSAQDVTDVTDATNRLQAHVCRLERRGIGGGPIVPDYCSLPDDVAAMMKRKKRKEMRAHSL